ncbi:MAG: glycosyltransferase [bacterium]
MKLLIITQKVDKNDDILGFFHNWLLEFSKRCEKLTVICLQKGEYDLPENVKVFSLGKEEGELRIKYVLNFWKYIWQERKNYDSVFVHMNPEYVVLGGLFWRLIGKKISLWYTHKSVDLKLKIAEKFSNIIFTVSKESFRMKTNKLKVVGHGIPVEKFKNQGNLVYKKDAVLKIISVGRITPIKNLDTLINACEILKKNGLNFAVSLIGPVVDEKDRKYFEYLKQLISEKDLDKEIKFLGSIPNNKLAEFYWQNDFSINLCPTGGVDKAILESMASGLITLASNIAFEEYFGEYKEDLMFKEKDEKDLAAKIMKLISTDDLVRIKNFLLSSVKEKTDLDKLLLRIINEIK